MKTKRLITILLMIMPLMGCLYAQSQQTDQQKASEILSYIQDSPALQTEMMKIFGKNTPDVFLNESNERKLRMITNRDLLSEILEQYWNEGVWVNDYRHQHAYDVSNYLVETLMQMWEEDQWNDNSKMTYTNDASGNPTLITSYQWDETTSGWTELMRTTISYTAFGEFQDLMMQMNMGGVWMDFMHITYSYNASQLCTEILTETLDFMSGTMMYSDRATYTYDGNNFLVNILDEDWDGAAWYNYSNEAYTNNAQGYCTEMLETMWDNSAWENALHFVYTYDASWNLIEELEELWSLGVWNPNYMFYYTYNASGNMTHELAQRWEGEVDGWVNDYQSIYTYGPTGINEFSISSLTVAPNPCSNFIKLDMSLLANDNYTVELFSYDGKLIEVLYKGQLLEGENSLYLSLNNALVKQSKGMHFLKISDDSGYSQCEKLIIY